MPVEETSSLPVQGPLAESWHHINAGDREATGKKPWACKGLPHSEDMILTHWRMW